MEQEHNNQEESNRSDRRNFLKLGLLAGVGTIAGVGITKALSEETPTESYEMSRQRWLVPMSRRVARGSSTLNPSKIFKKFGSM